MDTEQPENDVTGSRRRSPLVVASVAAAVLLAGGGVAFWASHTPGKAAPGGTGATAPSPLALDVAADGSAPPGIAPGEPDPRGGRVVHRAVGELPEGPGRAGVYRAGGPVTADEVARLAKALGLPGTPRAEGASWKVGAGGDGSGPLLRVSEEAPGTWSFSRYASGGPDACEPGAVCGERDRGPATGSPVGEEEAKAAAAPVLEAVGQEGAALDAGQLMGSVRVVNADPVVGGLPTYGWTTGIQVGPDGEVVGGSGSLKALEKADDYPVVGAGEALEQLNAESRRSAKTGIGGCATPVPHQEGGQPPARCGTGPADGGGEAVTVAVEKAVFGLSAQYADGRQVLVPSWIFSVRQEPGGAAGTVVRVAVDPAHLERERTPAPQPTSGTGDTGSGERRVLAYSAEGRTLDVTFWGGVCSTYTAEAEEDASAVRVRITESEREPGRPCILVAKELTRTVALDAPLDGRKVVDAVTGAEIPRG
ncbi:hypothetical protein CP967_25275 [Streptomyces nitrosporeus]|uniref:Large membrane protein n=1 Tax=Streptomyces nitrosporeus TaxID=28894 RepID=A0A5J6FIT4_9ACTN|nr:hypothetical protein [Streptomyces nitrosporeus]QEU74855.1 hypothetical protein CP967_25275 [Streptomyces nitrosporeus]GGZ26905.1 membrane protein [Streptomyces nitrosporeus]